ncbi:putative DEAD-box ATP-dependent RNA helicase 35 [Cocos nucifera]|uniref:Putative DEAD-box ATP-dependent RNA helicase 35 n=1 Tax=Cocos nucifera TaxID=13894 RepID=A0A8K0ISY3_COCNU|nr:putative DEAD-box ATP-dependent RNA helicase 35 [Cocos nucifera]
MPASDALPPKPLPAGGTTAVDNLDDNDYAEYIPIKKRRVLEAQKILQCKGYLSFANDGGGGGNPSTIDDDPDRPHLALKAKPSLLVKASQLKCDLSEIIPMEQRI